MKNQIPTLIVGLTLAVHSVLGQVVEIPDPGLQAAIREALDKPTGDITVADMESLTELDSSLAGRTGVNPDAFCAPFGEQPPPPPPTIQSLTGLQTAVNLTHLKLDGLCYFAQGTFRSYQRNLEVSDCSPLRSLTGLTLLDLGDNGLELPDVSFLAGLTNLTTLDFSYNDLTTFTLPEGLTRLTTLNLVYSHQLTTVNLPQGLISLTTLDLRNSQLTSLVLPDRLNSLTTLNLNENKLTSLTLPGDMTNLTVLNVGNNPIENLAVPIWMDLSKVDLDGFAEEQITFHAGKLRIEGGDLRWSQGVLQFAPNANGPWMDLPAASPMSLSPVGERGFFRVMIGSPVQQQKPTIDGTVFGSITIEGTVHPYDVVVRLDGTIERRSTILAAIGAGNPHLVTQAEAELIYQEGATHVIVGSGQSGVLSVSDDAAAFFESKGCTLEVLPTPQAVEACCFGKRA